MPNKTIYVRQSDFRLFADLKALAHAQDLNESVLIAEAVRLYVEQRRDVIETIPPGVRARSRAS